MESLFICGVLKILTKTSSIRVCGNAAIELLIHKQLTMVTPKQSIFWLQIRFYHSVLDRAGIAKCPDSMCFPIMPFMRCVEDAGKRR